MGPKRQVEAKSNANSGFCWVNGRKLVSINSPGLWPRACQTPSSIFFYNPYRSCLRAAPQGTLGRESGYPQHTWDSANDARALLGVPGSSWSAQDAPHDPSRTAHDPIITLPGPLLGPTWGHLGPSWPIFGAQGGPQELPGGAQTAPDLKNTRKTNGFSMILKGRPGGIRGRFGAARPEATLAAESAPRTPLGGRPKTLPRRP